MGKRRAVVRCLQVVLVNALLLLAIFPCVAAQDSSMGSQCVGVQGIPLVKEVAADELPMFYSGSCRFSSFCIDEEAGDFYIADNLRSCIIRVSLDGSRDVISLPMPMSLGSIEFYDGQLYVLDNVRDLSEPAKLHVLSTEGKLVTSYELLFFEEYPHPMTGEKLYRKMETVYSAKNGIVISDGTEYLLTEALLLPQHKITIGQGDCVLQQLEYANYSYEVPYRFKIGHPMVLKQTNDAKVCFSYWDIKDYGMYRRVAAISSSSGEVRTHYLPSGSNFLNDPIRFDSNGQLYIAWLNDRTLVISRVDEFDLAEQAALVLQSTPYWGDICILEADDYVDAPIGASSPGDSIPEGNRNTLLSRAVGYKDLRWWYDPAKNSTCQDGITRGTQPAWLSSISTPQYVTGVPYNWSGTQTVQGFLRRISEGYQAGNVATESYDNLIAGVDCSGFVWGVYYNRDDDRSPGDKSIHTSGHFKQLSDWSEAYLMDVGLWINNHAVLFTGERDSSTIFTIESTGASALGSRVCTYYRSKAQYPPWRNVAYGLSIISPNGGEIFQKGSNVQIKWSRFGIPDTATVNIDISTNGGVIWMPLFQAIPNTGFVNWTIGTTSTTQARLRIRAHGTEDISDGVFSVSDPLRVISPNGGETWEQYRNNPITWATGVIGGNVRIELSVDGGSSWQTIIANTPNSGYYNWYTTGFAPTTRARIRITSLSYPTFSDTSDGDFRITDANR